MTDKLHCPYANLIRVKFIGFWDNIIFRDTEKPLNDNSGLIIEVDGKEIKFTHDQWEKFKKHNKGHLLCNGNIN